MGVREQKKERNRRIILESARKIFAGQGYHNTSISDIIRQTELSRATFYLYFQNKGDIYKTLMVDIFRDMSNDFRRIRRGLRDKDMDMRAVLELSASSLFHTMTEHKDLVQTIINSPVGLDEEFDSITNRYINLLTEATTLAVKQGIARNQIEMPGPELAGSLVYGGLKEAIDRIVIRKEWDGTTDEAIEFIVRFYMGALEAFAIAAAGR